VLVTDETARIPCVGGVVVHGGRLLLVQRGQQPSMGLWSIPGGRLEAGEMPEAGCAREVLEETGLAVAVVAFVGRVERDAPAGGVYVIDDFLCAPTEGGDPLPAVTAGDDAADARWFSRWELEVHDAAGLVAPGVLHALRDWHVVDALT
jgi:8-oxo-dGTP diphosphatase